MTPLPTTLVGSSRGRITRRIAALENVIYGTNPNAADGTLITRTPRGTFIRSRARGTAAGTGSQQSQIPRWL
jgi:hypothetical protein